MPPLPSLTSTDPTALAETYALAFPGARPWSASEIDTLIAGRHAVLLGDARAFLIAQIVAGEAEILTVATHPHHLRQGHARRLLMQLAARAPARIFLEVAADNQPARALYDAQGFREIGRRAGYYTNQDGQKSDALILERVGTARVIGSGTDAGDER